MTKGTQVELGPKFGDLLPASENASGQTAKQKEAVKNNMNGMGLYHQDKQVRGSVCDD